MLINIKFKSTRIICTIISHLKQQQIFVHNIYCTGLLETPQRYFSHMINRTSETALMQTNNGIGTLFFTIIQQFSRILVTIKLSIHLWWEDSESKQKILTLKHLMRIFHKFGTHVMGNPEALMQLY